MKSSPWKPTKIGSASEKQLLAAQNDSLWNKSKLDRELVQLGVWMRLIRRVWSMVSYATDMSNRVRQVALSLPRTAIFNT